MTPEKPSDNWIKQKILDSGIDERIKEVFHTDETTSLMCDECNYLTQTRFIVREGVEYTAAKQEIFEHLKNARHSKYTN